MSRPVDERLRDLEAEVQDLRLLPAAAVRVRGRRRGRRQVAALMVAGAVVATTAGVAVNQTLHQSAAPLPVGDGPGIGAGLSCVLTLPDSPAAVHLRVLDGGAPAGSPASTAAQLTARSFTVLADAAAPTDLNTGSAAALRYGPAAIGAAVLVRAELRGEVVMRFDPDRNDQTIDLTLGPAFTRLATTTELNQALVTAAEPSPPPQCS